MKLNAHPVIDRRKKYENIWVILVWRENDPMPFVTAMWREGDREWFHGHYFSNIVEAAADYDKRCGVRGAIGA